MCHFSTDRYTTDLGISLLSWWLQRPGRPDKLYYRYLRRQVCAVVGFWEAKFKYWSVWVGCLYMRSLTGPCRLVCRWSAVEERNLFIFSDPCMNWTFPVGSVWLRWSVSCCMFIDHFDDLQDVINITFSNVLGRQFMGTVAFAFWSKNSMQNSAMTAETGLPMALPNPCP